MCSTARWSCRAIRVWCPPALIVARFFADEQAAIDALQSKQEIAARALEEYTEEHGGDEGVLADAANNKGKTNKGSVHKRLRELQKDRFLQTGDDGSADELVALERCMALIAEADATKAVRDAQAALDAKVLARYATLTEAEIKMLVVDCKWFAAMGSAVDGEVQRLTQGLDQRGMNDKARIEQVR